MKNWIVRILLFTITAAAPALSQRPLAAQPAPVPILIPTDEAGEGSLTYFHRALAKLKSEREALNSDWSSLTRRLAVRPSSDAPDLERLREQLNKAINRLKQERARSSQDSVAPTLQPILPKSPDSTLESKKTPDGGPAPGNSGATSLQPTSSPVDVLHLAQTLYRAERYEEALAAFRQVDLKDKRAEERAPIVYLTAHCLHQLGKTDDAISLLRETANSRGDARYADYAQWQIENLRWHREAHGRLQDIRQRRLATEKR